MHYTWLDTILIVSTLSFVSGGWRSGLIQSIGSVVGLFVGEIVAGRTYEHYASWVSPVFGSNLIAGKIFAFILIFLIVSRLIGLLFWFVNKMFNVFTIVPGLKILNQVGGAVFGFIEASLFIGITLNFVIRLPISSHMAQWIHDSITPPYFLAISGWLVPLLPKILKDSQNALEHVIPKNMNTNVNVFETLNTAQKIQNTGVVK